MPAEMSLIRLTSDETVSIIDSKSGKTIEYWELWADRNDENKVYIHCDMCGISMRIHGAPGKRGVHNVARHRGVSQACQKAQRRLASSSCAIQEEERQAHEAVFGSGQSLGGTCILPTFVHHVGHHILKAQRGVDDPRLGAQWEIGLEACGWCGRDGCITEMTARPRRPPAITSNCPYHYSGMRYGVATTSTRKTPCTNVPVQCTMCPKRSDGQHPTIWKYNFWNHLDTHHFDEHGQPEIIPPELLPTVRISDIPPSDAPNPDDYIPPTTDTFGGFTFADTGDSGRESRERSFSNLSVVSTSFESRAAKSTRQGG